MITEFETWLQENREALNDDSFGLFQDSLKCFKNDIDRPSYLLAYQGMMMQIRQAVQNSSCPTGYNAGKWNALQSELNRPDKWDAALFDAIRERGSNVGGVSVPPVVNIHDSVRDDFLHWRDLRNVCAHYKDAVFTKAHTLTLYAFIQQNLMSITVQGGFEMLMQEFKDYYTPSKVDITITPIEPLLAKIDVMIQPAERIPFINALVNYVMHIPAWNEHLNMMNKMWDYNASLKKLLIQYLNTDKDLRWIFLETRPSAVFELYHREEIHELWFMYLPKMDNGCAVLAELLNAGLIPDGEKDKIPLHILERKFASDKVAGELTAMQVAMLQSIHYFDIFMSKYMDSDYTGAYPNYSILNSKLRFYISHLHYVNFRIPDNAKRIYEVFSHHNCAYLLVSDFHYYLNQNHDDYIALRDTLTAIGLTIPDKIKIDESTL